MIRILILSGIPALFLYLSSNAQLTETPEYRYITAEKTTRIGEIYDSLFQLDLRLVNGRVHTAKYPSGIGHPFFLTGEPVPGTICMDGREYKHSYIRYDLLNDGLQIFHFIKSGPQIIDLNKKNIEAFSIEGHHFINMTGVNVQGTSPEEGFFEEKYKGPYSYLIRRKKLYLDNITGSRGGYEEYTYRYLYTPRGLFRITNRRSLLKPFMENQEKIKEYIRKSQLTVKLATDEQIINLIKYHASITGSF